MTPRDSDSQSGKEPMDAVSTAFAATVSGELSEVAEGIYMLPGFGNCTLIIDEAGVAREGPLRSP